MGKQNVFENILLFLLLGTEAWYLMFLPFYGQGNNWGFMGAYFLLLMAYPLSKKQRINISKRELYLTVYMRWIVLNIATALFMSNTMSLLKKRNMVYMRMLVLILAGGITLYCMLVIIRLCSKSKQNAIKRVLAIFGKYDMQYHTIDEMKKDIQRKKKIVFHPMLAECSLWEIESSIKQYDEIYILDIPSEHRNEIMKLCFKHRKPVYCAAKISDIMIQDGYTIKNGDKPLFCCDKYCLTQSEAIMKRVFDVICSVVAIILFFPLTLLIAGLIKLEDGGSVIYKQTRCTKDGKEFQIYKFRSMVIDSEPDGAQLATAHDNRITRIGQFLRNTKLDELPQLINILAGDMSIVGPRPERPELIKKIRQQVPEFDLRMHVKAGLTGYAQVQGNYNTSPLDKLKWDLMYINEYSPILDLKIIIMTPFVVFIQNNREE